MSETYTKLFGSITDSTIWLEPDPVRLVWITMLAMADRYGYVGASMPGLAARARVSNEDCEAALHKFLSPDEHSRSKEYDGRRIEVADRGWNLLNYERYRDMRDEEVRKEYERKRKRDQRQAAKKGHVPDTAGTDRDKPGLSRNVPECPAMSAQAEAEAEASAYTEAKVEKEQKTVPALIVTPRRTIQTPSGNARSKHPVFSGQRLVVFEWMFDDCRNVLGEHLDSFGIDAWFYALDAQAVAQGLVIPKKDGGSWLQSQLVAECQRRGLPISFAVTLPPNKKHAAMVAGSRAFLEQARKDGYE